MARRPEIHVSGTEHYPKLLAKFGFSDKHEKKSSIRLLDFVKELPGRKWDPNRKVWTITGVGPHPEKTLTDAGFDIIWPDDLDESFDDIESLDELVEPLARITDDESAILVRPRLLGYTEVSKMLGPGAVWESKTERFSALMSEIADVAEDLDFLDDEMIDAIQRARPGRLIPDYDEDLPVDLLAKSVTTEGFSEDFEDITRAIGDIPEWFGLDLYEYQRMGAIAALAGFRVICDEPGLGKCVDYATEVSTQAGRTAIGDLWQARSAHAYPDPEEPTGDLIDLHPGEIIVDAIDPKAGRIVQTAAAQIFRQRYISTMKTVRLSDGRAITCTPAHMLWTEDGWTRSEHLRPGDRVGVNDGRELSFLSVTEVSTTEAGGYVYDLCVPGFHSYTAEGIVSHNTRTSLAAAAMVKPRRTLVVSPPVVVTHWAREAETSRLAWAPELDAREIEVAPGHAEPHGGVFTASAPSSATTGRVVNILPGRKLPEFPDTGVIVVSDSYLSAKPEVVELLRQWDPQVLIDDESHRHANITAKRTRAVLSLALNADYVYAMSGTPMTRDPSQLTGQLMVSGAIDAFGSSVGEFLDRYCYKNKFGKWLPRKKRLPELGEILADDVWVRRTKAEALPHLPKKSRVVQWLDVPLKEYREAANKCVEDIHERIERFVEEHGRIPKLGDIKSVIGDDIRFSSPLLIAAGMAKVDPVADAVSEHLTATGRDPEGKWDRPITLWTWHEDVSDAISEALTDMGYESRIIRGETSKTQRDRVIDDFQAGEYPVLVASISAANFGITLTRSCDAYFLESDWTPANISQAEDRNNRIGQTRPTTSTTFSAVGTLDERMHGSQIETAEILNPVLTNGDNLVSGALEDHEEDPMLRLHDVVESLFLSVRKQWDPETLTRKVKKK